MLTTIPRAHNVCNGVIYLFINLINDEGGQPF